MLTPWAPSRPAQTAPTADQLVHSLPNAIPRINLPVLERAPDAPVLHLLVVDDDDPVREGCLQIAEKMGFAVRGAASVPEAEAVLNFHKVDVLLLDLKLPGGNALNLLENLKAASPSTEVVVMTAYATVPSAVRAMQIGANHYITKPFALDELTAILDFAGQHRQVDIESRRLRERLRNESSSGPLIGHSPEMEKLYRIISKVANSNHPIIIQGESGTGKETVARSIHFNGPTAARPFIAVDCGLPGPTHIENELFGYTKGAFAGAVKAREGLLGIADGATIFLDEVGELPPEIQSRLLRALQDREFRPLGTTQTTPVTVRVLAASSRDLSLLVDQGRFRRDLYLRLNMVNLRLPPLRERVSDIPLLAMHFLKRFNQRPVTPHLLGTRKLVPVTFAYSALAAFSLYNWPGNVRQLEEAVNCACTVSTDTEIPLGQLPTYLQEFYSTNNARQYADDNTVSANLPGITHDLPITNGQSSLTNIVSIADMEKKAILNSIRQLSGDKLKAAKLLGIGKTTLYRKLKEYGIAEEV